MGSFYMESTQINYRRDETVKTVDQKLQELSETSAIDTDIAPVFKSTNTYAPGDMVYYRNKLYVFNVEHTGAWAAADVTATDVSNELSSLKSGLTNVESALTNKISVEVSYIPAQDSFETTLAAGGMYIMTCARFGVVDFSVMYTDSNNISVTHINTSQDLTFTTSGRTLNIANAASSGYRVSILRIFWN